MAKHWVKASKSREKLDVLRLRCSFGWEQLRWRHSRVNSEPEDKLGVRGSFPLPFCSSIIYSQVLRVDTSLPKGPAEAYCQLWVWVEGSWEWYGLYTRVKYGRFDKPWITASSASNFTAFIPFTAFISVLIVIVMTKKTSVTIIQDYFTAYTYFNAFINHCMATVLIRSKSFECDNPSTVWFIIYVFLHILIPL